MVTNGKLVMIKGALHSRKYSSRVALVRPPPPQKNDSAIVKIAYCDYFEFFVT